MEKTKLYGECTKCWSWGEAPENFRETKHFLKCPVCKSAMFLVHHNPTNPNSGFSGDKKVTITELINHKG